MKKLPSADVLPRLIKLDEASGRLFWRERSSDLFSAGKQTADHNCAIWNGRYADKEAFLAIDSVGYRTGSIFDVKVRAHRVVWAITNGEWPTSPIDHRNRNKLDNRPSNLALSNHSLNAFNTGLREDNSSGQKGVTWHKGVGKWMAQITARGQHHYLGVFESVDDAVSARKAAEARLQQR